jgi:hypothetical protein
MSRSDLKDLGEALDEGQAGLIAVYETNLADQIVANIANRLVYAETDMAADQLAEDLAEADADMARARPQIPVPSRGERSPEAPATVTATKG